MQCGLSHCFLPPPPPPPPLVPCPCTHTCKWVLSETYFKLQTFSPPDQQEILSPPPPPPPPSLSLSLTHTFLLLMDLLQKLQKTIKPQDLYSYLVHTQFTIYKCRHTFCLATGNCKHHRCQVLQFNTPSFSLLNTIEAILWLDPLSNGQKCKKSLVHSYITKLLLNRLKTAHKTNAIILHNFKLYKILLKVDQVQNKKSAKTLCNL